MQKRIEKWISILDASDSNPVGTWGRKRESEIDSNPVAISNRLYALIAADEYLMDAAREEGG